MCLNNVNVQRRSSVQNETYNIRTTGATRSLTADVDKTRRLWTLLSKSISVRSEYMSQWIVLRE